MKKSKGMPNWLIYLFGSLGGFLFGYNTAVISGAMLYLQEDLQLNSFQIGLVVSSVAFGALFGAVACGVLSDKFGRRKTILLLAILFTVGALGSGVASGIIVLLFFRLILGFAVGGISGVGPNYLAELAPVKTRGLVTSANGVMTALGMLSAYSINLLLSNDQNWRWMVGFAAIPAAVLVIGMLFMPESAKWLANNNQLEKAEEILGMTYTDEAEIESELFQMRYMANKEEKGSFSDLLTPVNRKILIIGIILAMIQQFTGINAVQYFAPSILIDAGFGDSAALISTIGLGILNLGLTVLGVFLVDRWGRKKLLLFGSLGATISLVGIYLASSNAYLTIAIMAIFLSIIACTWGLVLWILLAEIFPLKIRGLAIGICSFFLWLSNSFISLVFPLAVSRFGTGTIFLGFGVICLASFFFVKRYVPETKGRTLEEIELDFRFDDKFEKKEIL
jgi:sugar porter (SP) family MFS transporter